MTVRKAAKKTAKKAAPRPRRQPTPPGPEQPAQSGEPVRGQIEFQGRIMRVEMPQPEQIVIWRRIQARLASANVDDWTGKEAVDALERTRKIIDNVLIDQADIDWLDDQMLDGKVTLKEASVIVVEAVKSFQNRAQRRATKAAGPARRKKAA